MTFVATGSTSYQYIHRTLSALSLGTIGEISMSPIRKGAKTGMVSVVCHYNTFTEDKLRADLSGGVPRRIVHGTTRKGNEMYWQLYKTKTLDEREWDGFVAQFT